MLGSVEGWCDRHGQAVIFAADIDRALEDAVKLAHKVQIRSAPPA
jgi:hypothetical protein